MSHLLSRGAMKEIADGQDYSKPVFQVLALKKLSANSSGGSATDRYRLLLSDGVHSNSALLAVQLNKLVDDNTMELFSVIRLDRFVCNPLPDNRNVMIVLEVSILTPGSEVGHKISNPVSVRDAAGLEREPTSHRLGVMSNLLTKGAIKGIADGQDFTNPIFQLLVR